MRPLRSMMSAVTRHQPVIFCLEPSGFDLKDALRATAQSHGELSPIGGIGQPDSGAGASAADSSTCCRARSKQAHAVAAVLQHALSASCWPSGERDGGKLCAAPAGNL